MNIKLKAGLQVAGLFLGASIVALATRLSLDYLASITSPETVANGAIFALLCGAAYFIGGLLYDIRLNQLKYKETLEEMTKK
jgi:hypothetical protein